MQIPKRPEDALSHALDRLEIVQREDDARLKRQPGRTASLARMYAIKHDNYDMLLGAASAVLAWRDEFLTSRLSQRLWQLLGSDANVRVYVGMYHDGHEVPPDVDVAWTEIVLSGPGHHFRMEEWTSHRKRPKRSQRLSQPRDLVDLETMHPQMLVDLAAFLTGPDRYGYIEAFVKAEAEFTQPSDSTHAQQTPFSGNG